MRVDESFEGLGRLRQSREIATPVFDSIEVRHGASPFLSPTILRDPPVSSLKRVKTGFDTLSDSERKGPMRHVVGKQRIGRIHFLDIALGCVADRQPLWASETPPARV
jgi:hypothetical protein